MNVDLKTAKRQFSTIGWGVFAISAAATVLQLAAGFAASLVWPQGDWPSWVLWLLTFAPTYLVAVPIGLLILKKAPAVPPEAPHPLKPGQFVTAAIISIFMMYAGNFLGTLVLGLLQTALGWTAENPLLAYVADDAVLLRVLVMVIAAPVIEEYIFRKQFIDRTRMYGERLAVVLSALAFGLFHGNLSQFFYAFGLGLVFGYVYAKTGKLRWTIALHMMINFLGSVLAPALQNGIDLAALDSLDPNDMAAVEALLPQMLPLILYALLLLALSGAGLVLFCVQLGRLHFAPAALELPKGTRLKTACLNSGMLVFFIGSLALFAFSFLS